MLRIGLTGGIASGKSTVAALLRELGFHVIDADRLAHRLTEPGQPAYEEVIREFSSAILDSAGRIDRPRLAATVFADRAKLDRLNAIVHPRVEESLHRQMDDWQGGGVRDPVFVEAALLVEAGYHKKLDGLIVVWCRPEQQLSRLAQRGMSREDALRRIASQLPLEKKLQYATEKIDSSGSLDYTHQQVEALAANWRRHPSNG
jgi:dephospho-CoA kinase